MQLSSQSLVDGAAIPVRHAMGVPGANGPEPGANVSPALSWSGFPAGTRSFVLVCVDPDAPSVADDVNRSDRQVPYALPRASFFHWLLVDIPVGVTSIAEGADATGLTPRGKPAGRAACGVRGLNDYTGWFAGDEAMSGQYGGYDGPWPPFNDERVHRYHFTIHALDVESLALPLHFSGSDVLAAMAGHVLDQATITVTYALNPEARL